MATNLNRVNISGRLTKDIALTETRNGNFTASFSVGSNYYAGKGEPEGVSFLPVRVFGRTAEFVSKYFKKGDEIFVDGVLREDSWQKDGKHYSTVYVLAESVYFGRKKASPAGEEPAPDPEEAPLGGSPDGDLPF